MWRHAAQCAALRRGRCIEGVVVGHRACGPSVGLVVVLLLLLASLAPAAAQETSTTRLSSPVTGEVITLGADTEIFRDDFGVAGSWGVTSDEAASIAYADGALSFDFGVAPRWVWTQRVLGAEVAALWVRASLDIAGQGRISRAHVWCRWLVACLPVRYRQHRGGVGGGTHRRPGSGGARAWAVAAEHRPDAGRQRHRQPRVRDDRHHGCPRRGLGRWGERRRRQHPRCHGPVLARGSVRRELRRRLRSGGGRCRGRYRRDVRAADA